jgi:hypothetical protein
MSEVNLAVLRARYVEDFRGQADSMERERDQMLELPSHMDWVVVLPGNIAVSYKVESEDDMAARDALWGEPRLTDPKPTSVKMAVRMTQELALKNARKTFNGNGEYGEAMRVTDLMTLQIAALRKSADDIEALPPL